MEKEKVEKLSLSPKGVSEDYPISEGVLGNLRWQKRGPKYFKVGRKVLYRREDIERWLYANPVLTTDSM